MQMAVYSVMALAFGVVITARAAELKGTNACAPAAILTNQRGWELGEGTYRAHSAGDTITITAVGENPTAGYQVQLTMQPVRIYPPKFVLYRKRPVGISAQVITPFTVCATLKSAEKLKVIAIRDASGEHRVPVEHGNN